MSTSTNCSGFAAAVVGFIFGVMSSLALTEIFSDYSTNYMKGQVDAMNGQVAFELKPAEDGSIQWFRIDKEK